jgi:hypothetical protein
MQPTFAALHAGYRTRERLPAEASSKRRIGADVAGATSALKASCCLLLIRLFQQNRAGCFSKTGLKPDILGVVEPSTTTAGGDLKEPDKRVLPKGRMDF